MSDLTDDTLLRPSAGPTSPDTSGSSWWSFGHDWTGGKSTKEAEKSSPTASRSRQTGSTLRSWFPAGKTSSLASIASTAKTGYSTVKKTVSSNLPSTSNITQNINIKPYLAKVQRGASSYMPRDRSTTLQYGKYALGAGMALGATALAYSYLSGDTTRVVDAVQAATEAMPISGLYDAGLSEATCGLTQTDTASVSNMFGDAATSLVNGAYGWGGYAKDTAVSALSGPTSYLSSLGSTVLGKAALTSGVQNLTAQLSGHFSSRGVSEIMSAGNGIKDWVYSTGAKLSSGTMSNGTALCNGARNYINEHPETVDTAIGGATALTGSYGLGKAIGWVKNRGTVTGRRQETDCTEDETKIPPEAKLLSDRSTRTEVDETADPSRVGPPRSCLRGTRKSTACRPPLSTSMPKAARPLFSIGSTGGSKNPSVQTRTRGSAFDHGPSGPTNGNISEMLYVDATGSWLVNGKGIRIRRLA